MSSVLYFVIGTLVGVLISLSVVSHLSSTNVPNSSIPFILVNPAINNGTTILSTSQSYQTNMTSYEKSIKLAENSIRQGKEADRLQSPDTDGSAMKSRWIPGRDKEFVNFIDKVSHEEELLIIPSSLASSSSEELIVEDKNDRSRKRKRRQKRNPSLMNNSTIGSLLTSPSLASSTEKKATFELVKGISREAGPERPEAPQTQGIRVYALNRDSAFVSERNLSLLGPGWLPYPPWVPYHAPQLPGARPLNPPYVPSLASVTDARSFAASLLQLQPAPEGKPVGSSLAEWKAVAERPLPDLSRQRASFEAENLKLHLCNGVFEAYSASYLTTRAHMLEVKSEGYNLTWVNCEMASFIHMRESNNFYVNPSGSGMILQARLILLRLASIFILILLIKTVDVLDFSVIHLSTYERSRFFSLFVHAGRDDDDNSNKYRFRLWKSKEDLKKEWHKIAPIEATARELEQRLNRTPRPVWSAEARRTLVVMPFLGGAMGAGHSELGNRFHYLRACFWSFYEFFPNIMMGVSRREDVTWGFNESGLPFFDIVLLDKLPKSAGLPVGTTQQVKARLQDGRYDFDYIFFTESDQILISRQLPLMFENLKRYPGRMLLPHRLMVYSDRIMREVHQKNVSETRNEWMRQSCCLPRQNCVERKSWVPLADPSVSVINYYGLLVPLGNVNFLRFGHRAVLTISRRLSFHVSESYRACSISDYYPDYCP